MTLPPSCHLTYRPNAVMFPPDTLALVIPFLVSLRGKRKRRGCGATSLARQASTEASGC